MNADSRAEGWKRAAWAADHVIVGQSEGADVGLVVLEALQDSPLASASDRELLEGCIQSLQAPDDLSGLLDTNGEP